ncbi:MAG TPA: DUF4382 domain-containing protein [Candidatus Paceibacterota bacterium]|nr:DUF4382 domain-containing protein [Candidatus Paceibacterota bacterium]
MKNNNTGKIIGIVILLVVVIWGVMAYSGNKIISDDSRENGALYIGVTDATADIENINEVRLSVQKVEIYNEVDGWVTVSSNSEKYSLFQLRDNQRVELYAKEDVAVGSYERVRVTIGNVDIEKINGESMRAEIPSSQIVADVNVEVIENQTSYVLIDFLADKSLHVAIEGDEEKYIFAPVVMMESRSNATVAEGMNNILSVSGGNLESSANVGMDLSGNSRMNFELVTDKTLRVNTSSGQSQFVLGEETYVRDSNDRNTMFEVEESVEMNIIEGQVIEGKVIQGPFDKPTSIGNYERAIVANGLEADVRLHYNY